MANFWRSVLYFGAVLFILNACSSTFKRGENSFDTDSDFLNQGRKIEDYKPETSAKKKDNELNPNNSSHKKTLKKHPKKLDKNVKAKPDEDSTETSKKSVSNLDSSDEKSKTKQSFIKTTSGDKVGEIKKTELSNDSKREFPFKVGEEVTLSATFFGVEAGKILIGVDKYKKFEGQRQYHFYALGKTATLFSMFYKVRNRIEALWSPKLKKPRTLAFDVAETKQKYKTRAYFNWEDGTGQYFEEGWDKKKGDYRVEKNWKLEPKAQDILSSVFYTRTLPLKVGKEYKVTVMEEDKVITAYLKVDRKEVLKTRVGSFNTLVLKPRFSTEGKFKQVGDISIWLTDDSYRQIVRVESKIKIGTIIAKLHAIKRPK